MTYILPTYRPFLEYIFPIATSHNEREIPWMAFDLDGNVMFQNALWRSHALQALDRMGLSRVADDIRSYDRLSFASLNALFDSKSLPIIRSWIDAIYRMQPIIIDIADTFELFLDIDGAMVLSEKTNVDRLASIHPIYINPRHRLHMIHNALLMFERAIERDIFNPFERVFDMNVVIEAYRAVSTPSWVNANWFEELRSSTSCCFHIE